MRDSELQVTATVLVSVASALAGLLLGLTIMVRALPEPVEYSANWPCPACDCSSTQTIPGVPNARILAPGDQLSDITFLGDYCATDGRGNNLPCK